MRFLSAACGSDFDLMVDAHTLWRMGDRNYSLETGERLARQLAEFNIAWLEEPMPPDNHEAYRGLKELDCVPLASGATGAGRRQSGEEGKCRGGRATAGASWGARAGAGGPFLSWWRAAVARGVVVW